MQNRDGEPSRRRAVGTPLGVAVLGAIALVRLLPTDVRGVEVGDRVPETFVLSREGRIIKRVIGATDWDSPGNRALIEELLRM
ncbi:MAG: hypothetical protein JSV41_08675 [Gemmatimonadota bacterium]|nr:MAG: hypothetical protein JSV41_08675 [Gemmatimonadota bacterium]